MSTFSKSSSKRPCGFAVAGLLSRRPHRSARSGQAVAVRVSKLLILRRAEGDGRKGGDERHAA
jgi:hypothetical protein